MINVKKFYALIILIFLTTPLHAMDKISPLMEQEAHNKSKKMGEESFWAIMVNFVFKARDEIIPNIKDSITNLDSSSKKARVELIDFMSQEVNLAESISNDLTKGESGIGNILQLTTRMQKYFEMIRTSEKTYDELIDFLFNKLNVLHNLNELERITASLRKDINGIWVKRYQEDAKDPNWVFYMKPIQEIIPEKCVAPVILNAFFDIRDNIIPDLKKQLEEKQKSISLEFFMDYSNITDLRGKSWLEILKLMDDPKESLKTLNLMDKYFRDMK